MKAVDKTQADESRRREAERAAPMWAPARKERGVQAQAQAQPGASGSRVGPAPLPTLTPAPVRGGRDAITVEARRAELLQWMRARGNQSTQRTYGSGMNGFRKYMQHEQRAVEAATEEDVASYLRERVEADGVAASTMQSDRASIADFFKHTPSSGITHTPLVSSVVSVLRTLAAPSRPKRHMSAELMRDILSEMDGRAEPHAHAAAGATAEVKWTDERNVCLLLLMMMGMLRESEATGLRVSDVEVRSLGPTGTHRRIVRLFIRQSKTDQAKAGAVVLLGENTSERSSCPVWRLERLRAHMQREGVESEFCFPKHGGGELSSKTPCRLVQAAVEAANTRAEVAGRGASYWGDPREYGSHSLRRGGVSAARANGTSMLDIQRHGRWKSLTVFSYVGQSEEERLAVTQQFLRTDVREEVQRPNDDRTPPDQAVRALQAAGRSDDGAPSRARPSAHSSAATAQQPSTGGGSKEGGPLKKKRGRPRKRRIDSEEEEEREERRLDQAEMDQWDADDREDDTPAETRTPHAPRRAGPRTRAAAGRQA